MDIELLKNISSIREFFKLPDKGAVPEETKALFTAMTEVDFEPAQDIVTFGAGNEDGMYIIIQGTAVVLDDKGNKINTLSLGDFVGELGLINDHERGATVRAITPVKCANISKSLFYEIATHNTKIYGSFMNMLYTKTTKLVTEQERIKTELAVATQIQAGCLENDFTEFNKLPQVKLWAQMRPAKEVGGDFYDVFMIDDTHLCFLIADVSGKGIPAALFMSMAKIYIKTYATLGLSLGEVAARTNNQLCYKNDAGMFVTAFICVLDLETDEVTFVNAGHNLPYIIDENGEFSMVKAKANLVFGMMEDVLYREQKLLLPKSGCIYLYTDGVTEGMNPKQEFFGTAYLRDVLNRHIDISDDVENFVCKIYDEVDSFADGEPQADDITMVYLSRR